MKLVVAVSKVVLSAIVALTFPLISFAQTLENPQPGSSQSGIGILSGWSCTGPISVLLDGTAYAAAYGTGRADAASACGGNANVGFGLLFNFNILGNGNHTAQLRVNGVNVGGPVPFTVTVPAGEFATGLSKSITVPDFPSAGKNTQLVWQQSQQNFAISSITGTTGISCFRTILKTNEGDEYSYHSYTQNGTTLASLIARNSSQRIFEAAWTDSSLSTNPFLTGRSTSGFSQGIYGYVNVASSAYPLANGELIKITGDLATVLIVSSVSSGRSVFFYPTGPLSTQISCGSTSGTYVGQADDSYNVNIFSSGSGAMTRVDGSQRDFSANWTNGTGTVSVASSFYRIAPGPVTVRELGQNALLFYQTSSSGIVNGLATFQRPF